MVKHRRARRFRFAVALVLTLASTGCWDRTELEERAYIAAIGIDRVQPSTATANAKDPQPAAAKSQLELIQQYYSEHGAVRLALERMNLRVLQAREGSTELNLRQSQVYASTGPSIAATEDQLHTLISEQIFLGTVRVLILGEAAAREGLPWLLDYLQRSRLVRRQVRLLIAEGDALAVLGTAPGPYGIVGTHLHDLVEQSIHHGRAPDRDLGDISIYVHSKGPGIIVPRITLGEDIMKLAGSAVFKEEMFVGWLGELETRGVLWVLGEINSGPTVVVPSPTRPNDIVTFRLATLQSTVKPELRGDKPTFTVELRIEGDVIETSVLASLTELELIKEIENRVTQAVEGEIFAALARAQSAELQVDVFQFGHAFSKKFPKEWERLQTEWNAHFADATVEVDVTVKVRRTGRRS